MNINDKLVKVSDSFTVYMYDNGYMIEISGRDEDNDYRTAKVMCPTVDDLLARVKEAVTMTRDE